MSDRKTVRVRIAVAVNEQGHWGAGGNDMMNDRDKRKCAKSDIEGDVIVHWVTAEVPVPVAETVGGVVES